MTELEGLLIRQVDKKKTPSVQYIIFNSDIIIRRFQYGFGDIAKQQYVDERTSFHAFSVTKTFTALAILQLAEQGKLEIDRPVGEYLVDFPYSPEITARQLMAHSAGVPNPNPLSWIHLAGEHEFFDREDFFRRIFAKYNRLKSKPNEKYSYSNLGYVLLGQIIKKLSGMNYEDFIRENITRRLNIEPNELSFTLKAANRMAKGYHKKCSFSYVLLGLFFDKSKYLDKTEDGWKSFKPIYVNGDSYGGLIGTSNAFVRYVQELLKPNCKLLSYDFKRVLFTENYTNDKRATGMCLSWFKGLLNGRQYFAHAGGGGGYYCEIRIYPGQGIGSVIMFNRTGMMYERFLDKLDQFLID